MSESLSTFSAIDDEIYHGERSFIIYVEETQSFVLRLYLWFHFHSERSSNIINSKIMDINTIQTL